MWGSVFAFLRHKKIVPVEMIGTCWCVTVLVVAVLVISAKWIGCAPNL